MMSETKPTRRVFIFHGEDEFAIAQAVAEVQQRLAQDCDPSTADLNTSRLDGGSSSLEQIINAAAAMPFLAPRRLVIVTHPIARCKDKASQEKLKQYLAKTPPFSDLVLVQHSALTNDKDRKQNRLHWLEKWAAEHSEVVEVRLMQPPRGPEMAKRIIGMAKERDNGKIAGDAAELLGTLVDGDMRMAGQELDKLLAFVNYNRPIEYSDVAELTTDVGEGDIFQMVDALSAKDGRRAMAMLERLLEYQVYFEIFPMVVRQFRLLILAREALESGKNEAEMARGLGLHPYVAKNMLRQARNFGLPELELAYHRLLDIDAAVKTGGVNDRVGLESFVAEFTTSPRTNR